MANESPSTECPEMCLVGNISSAIEAIASKYSFAIHQSSASIQWRDLQVLLAVAILPHYILLFINNTIVNKWRKHPVEFHETRYLSLLCRYICQSGRLGLLVYASEVFIVFLSGLGVPHLDNAPRLLASLVYSLWMAHNVAELASMLLNRACSYRTCIQITLWNRIMTSTIYLVMTLLFLDANHINVGMAARYILTLSGGLSSVVMGLALKDPLAEIVQGTNLLLSDKFGVGDVTYLSTTKACGRIASFEWTDVVMEGDDNSVTRIPHSTLAKTQLVNMTRMQDSQVSQTLSLPNHGSIKIESLLQDLRTEIRESCPKLNAQEPFRVSLTDLSGDTIIISIESHFHIPRLSEEYWENRQAVLMAVNRAVVKYNKSK